MRPNRPPDISTEILLPSDAAVARLKAITEGASIVDGDMRLMAATLFALSKTVEGVVHALPGIASGNIVSLDPDVQAQSDKG